MGKDYLGPWICSGPDTIVVPHIKKYNQFPIKTKIILHVFTHFFSFISIIFVIKSNELDINPSQYWEYFIFQMQTCLFDTVK